MKIVKCAGYDGHACKNKIDKFGKSKLKYCPTCRIQQTIILNRKYKSSEAGKAYDKAYYKTEKGAKSKKESEWRRQGIIGLTYEIWQKDIERGCMFKFLGRCAGLLCADHESGQYRGPLCVHHNRALGKLGDSTKTLKQCIEILINSEIESRKQ